MKDAEAVDNLLRAAWYGALCRAVDQLRSENPSLGTAAVAESGDASMAGALRSKRDAGMRKLQSKHEAEMKSIRSTQEAEMKTLQSSHEAEMRTLQSRNDALDAEVQELRRLCTDQRAELEVSQEDIQHYKVVARKLQGMVDAMMVRIDYRVLCFPSMELRIVKSQASFPP